MVSGTFSGLLGLVHLALAILAIVEIAKSSKTTVLKVVWICVVLFAPCLGLIAYYFLGRS
jgi:hypothetical protein